MDMSGHASPLTRTSSVDLQHLRFAVAAAELGSFRQAAELLSVQQSTLSRCIRQLEHSIGVTVFERSSGGIKLTPAGSSVLRMARSILDEFSALITIAGSSQFGPAGRLSIGFCTSLSAGNLRATLLEFKQRFPLVDIATAEKSRTRLTASLRNSTLDVLIVTGHTPALYCKSLALWSERILLTLPKDHPLSERDVVYWTDLRGQSVLLSPYVSGQELEEVLNSKLLSPTDRPKVERHDVSRGAIKALVSMRMGISLVLESDLGANLPSPLYRELRDGTGPSRLGFYAVWRADNENPALHSFLALLAERYPSPDACG
jgi:DNA-binding transcriptional LysR family regulator